MVSVVIKTEGIVQLAKTLTDLAYKKDMVLRAVATTMRAVVAYRIHTEGKKADGSQIGTYSDKYLLRRQKSPYNREASAKVIASLTRQMENDFKVVETPSGYYGLGFSNELNYNKSQWIQDGATPHTVKAHTRHKTIKSKVSGGAGFKKGKFSTGVAKTVVIEGDSYPVKSYANKGWKGFGKIYDFTPDEIKTAEKTAEEYIQNIVNAIR